MISAVYRMSEAYWKQAYQTKYLYAPGRRAVSWVIAFLLVISMVLLFCEMEGKRLIPYPFFWISQGGLWLSIGHTSIYQWLGRRKARQAPGIDTVTEWTISGEGLAIDGFGGFQLIPWGRFSRVRFYRPFKFLGGESWILLSLPEGAFHWIPSSAFASPEAFEEATRLIPLEKIGKD